MKVIIMKQKPKHAQMLIFMNWSLPFFNQSTEHIEHDIYPMSENVQNFLE